MVRCYMANKIPESSEHLTDYDMKWAFLFLDFLLRNGSSLILSFTVKWLVCPVSWHLKESRLGIRAQRGQ